MGPPRTPSRLWAPFAQPALGIIVVLLLAGAILRPVVGGLSEPIAVAPRYARPAVTLYHVLEDGRHLVPVARRLPESETTPEHAVMELLAGPKAGPDLEAPFADSAQLEAFSRSGGQASVALAAGAIDGVDPGQAVSALVLTLTEFPEITSVSVSVGGEHLDADGAVTGSPISLSRPAVNPETPEAAGGGMELFFAYDGEDRYLVPVTRDVPLPQREPRLAMAEFLAGPVDGSGLAAVLPDDVSVLGVRVDDGLATVDFDSHLVYAYRLSKANATFVRRAVMATLTDLPDISAGLIEIDGSRLLLYTCVNVTQEFPQARPWAINDEYYLSTLPSTDSASA